MRNGRSRQLSGLDETLTAQPGHLLVGVLRIPEYHGSPVRVITRRVAIALLVLFVAAFIVYLDRSGYRDVRGDRLTFLDCLYFSAVSLSTTGYGDITPHTEAARLVNTVVFTPLRMAFLAVLVRTTLEVLSERSRQAWKIQRWRSKVRNHTIVVDYGTKGNRRSPRGSVPKTPRGRSSSLTPIGRPSTTQWPPDWSPCTATPPSPTCCGWPVLSTRPRSLWPPTATTQRCW